jgi:hypothetical protein
LGYFEQVLLAVFWPKIFRNPLHAQQQQFNAFGKLPQPPLALDPVDARDPVKRGNARNLCFSSCDLLYQNLMKNIAVNLFLPLNGE